MDILSYKLGMTWKTDSRIENHGSLSPSIVFVGRTEKKRKNKFGSKFITRVK